MKRFLAFFLSLMSFACFSAASAESVTQMTYMVKLPDVIREGLYTGEVQNGVPHGYGVFVTENSSGVPWHYLGEWDAGEMTGQGGQYWDIGKSQVGTYESNDFMVGMIHSEASLNGWIDFRLDEDGYAHVKDYRMDGTIIFDGYADPVTGVYKKGTFYTKDGKVFFSGEIGEGFNWDLIYIE